MPATSPFATLATLVRGPVVLPGDPDYDKHRRVWNGDVDRHPGAIVKCVDEADVATAVRFAVAEGISDVAVRSGGHSYPGLSVCDQGMVIDLGLMRAASIGASYRATVGGGCLLRDLDDLTYSVGRAVPAGIVSHTGVAGLTLGGGFGYLARRFGLTCDNLRSVRLVTADGAIQRVTDESDAELMWGLRGGGGNFGIVTEFEFDTHAIGPMLTGVLVYPTSKILDFIAFFDEFMKDAPRELFTIFWPFIPGNSPRLPPHLMSSTENYFSCFIVWCGDEEAGNRALAPLRAWNPVADTLTLQSFVDLQRRIDADQPHGTRCYVRAGFLSELSPPLMEAILERAHEAPPLCAVLISSLAGAITEVAEEDSAYSSRDTPFAYEIRADWIDPADRAAAIDWARSVSTVIEKFAGPSNYINFVTDEGSGDGVWVAGTPARTDRLQRLYGPAKFARLQAIKAQWDPANFFHLNQNVPPLVDAPV